jgi:hypothetical protein
MSEEDKRMLIRACIDKVFIPHATVNIQKFLMVFKDKILFSSSYEQSIGFPIGFVPTVLDLRESAEILEEALVTSFKTYKEQINKI